MNSLHTSSVAPPSSPPIFPVEVLEGIIDQLPDDILVTSQCVSKQWQALCERRAGIRLGSLGEGAGHLSASGQNPYLKRLAPRAMSLKYYKMDPCVHREDAGYKKRWDQRIYIGDRSYLFDEDRPVVDLESGTSVGRHMAASSLSLIFNPKDDVHPSMLSPDGNWMVGVNYCYAASWFRRDLDCQYVAVKKDRHASHLFRINADTHFFENRSSCFSGHFSSNSSCFANYDDNRQRLEIFSVGKRFERQRSIDCSDLEVAQKVYLSPRGRFVCLESLSWRYVFNTNDGAVVAVFRHFHPNPDPYGPMHAQGLNAPSFSFDERYLAFRYHRRGFQIYDITDKKLHLISAESDIGELYSLAFSTASNVLAIGVRESNSRVRNMVRLLEISSQTSLQTRLINSICFDGNPTKLHWSPLGNALWVRTYRDLLEDGSWPEDIREVKDYRVLFKKIHSSEINLKRSWRGTIKWCIIPLEPLWRWLKS